jgi:hypothetical protein
MSRAALPDREETGLQPTVFYRWQKEFFENGVSADLKGSHSGRL